MKPGLVVNDAGAMPTGQQIKRRAPRQESAPVTPMPGKDTKIGRVWKVLHAGGSLNRFQAEQIGDHCLNSTIAVLRSDGHNITGQWERVPTRFGSFVRVMRYRAVRGKA